MIIWAETGDYRLVLDGFNQGVTIPQSLCFAPPALHDFTARTANAPLQIEWDDLLETASWRDDNDGEKSGHWFARLHKVELLLRSKDGATFEQQRLDIDGLLHLAGMVSSGKSTWMEVLTVHVARQGRHVTLVLADVIDVLKRAALFEQFGIGVAPIPGATMRQPQLERLARFVAARDPKAGLDARHPAYRWFSTACALDGLRRDASAVIPLNARPRAQLSPVERAGANKRACPIYAKCEFHRAALDARGAKIWLATAASLVTTRVSPQLSRACAGLKRHRAPDSHWQRLETG